MKSLVIIFSAIVGIFSSPLDTEINPHIVGGENAEEFAAPYIISMERQRADGSWGHTCGATILNQLWVLTAGHCFTNQAEGAVLRAVAGQYDRSVVSGNEQIRDIEEFFVHPDYNGGDNPYDVAVFKLDAPLEFVEGIVEPGVLPRPEHQAFGEARLFGWGSISNTSQSIAPDILQTAIFPIIPLAECREIIRRIYPLNPLHRSNICVGPLTGGLSACFGDSGGPLTQQRDDGVTIVIGVTSWISAVPCGSVNAITVFGRVASFIDWIVEMTDGDIVTESPPIVETTTEEVETTTETTEEPETTTETTEEPETTTETTEEPETTTETTEEPETTTETTEEPETTTETTEEPETTTEPDSSEESTESSESSESSESKSSSSSSSSTTESSESSETEESKEDDKKLKDRLLKLRMILQKYHYRY